MIPKIKNIKKVKIIVSAKKLYISKQLFKTDFKKWNYLLINFVNWNQYTHTRKKPQGTLYEFWNTTIICFQ